MPYGQHASNVSPDALQGEQGLLRGYWAWALPTQATGCNGAKRKGVITPARRPKKP